MPYALTPAGRTFIVFPVAVGGSTLLYSLYQLARWQERLDPRKLLGLSCGAVGVSLLAMNMR